MYLLNIGYTRQPAEVAPHIKAHGEWVGKHLATGDLLFAGPKKSGLGGILLARGMPKPELMAMLAEDSYLLHDVADYQIVDFDIKAAQAGLEALKA